MLKKIILISVFLTLFISSCGKDKLVWDESLVWHKWQDFSIDIPELWQVLDNSWQLDLPKLKNWKLELVVSWEEKNWFKNNLIIISKDLEREVSTYDFALKNNPKDYDWYEYFFQKQAKDFEFADWEKTRLYEFVARYNKDSKDYIFMQSMRICNKNKSFFLTIGLSMDIKDTTIYENIFKSFKCN